MDTITMIIFVIVGIVSGIMLGVGTVMKYIMKSNNIGTDIGTSYDFKTIESGIILVKDEGHRMLGRNHRSFKGEGIS